jgi:hypothetical protein
VLAVLGQEQDFRGKGGLVLEIRPQRLTDQIDFPGLFEFEDGGVQVVRLVGMHAHEPLLGRPAHGNGRQRFLDAPRQAEVLREAEAFRVKGVGTGDHGRGRPVEGEVRRVGHEIIGEGFVRHQFLHNVGG